MFLFGCVGFLGSMSTFSSFISDLINTFLVKRWRQFLLVVLFSLVGGALAMAAGVILGNGL
ncbi:CrcB family protein [Prochlorococcus sp. MIT 1307]|uniref:CrcB family protein n=1 Tax=Prochlorococcus sp. MIT 1307 TaxID=3096219 RepID=UPI0039BF8DB1